jgi:hypothetical protein
MEDTRFYFDVDERGALVLDRSALERYVGQATPLRGLFQAVKRRSYLLSLISERAYLARLRADEQRFKQTHANADMSRNGLDEFSDLNVYLPDPTAHWRDAWQITEQAVLRLAREVEGRGASFVLVTLANAEAVHPELQRALAQQYGLPFDFELPDRRLRALAAAHGMRYLGLMPAFLEHHRRTGIYLHGFGSSIDGHWNAAGHRLAAEVIFRFLKEERLVPLD